MVFFYKYSVMKIDLSLFNEEVLVGTDLCQQIETFGYEAYLVGGCVRDIVRWYKNGQKGDPKIHDVDIATNMPIDELYDNFKCTSNNGEAHGTILVKWQKEVFEVTQFRTDGDYSDGRHPDSVQFTKSFKDDVARRDFTINAMGIDCRGNLIDYYNGEKDLDDNILRTVGDSNQRFSEDALRIIRAMRFAARFGMKIDDDTFEGIKNIKGNLNKIAKERIGAELMKTAEYGKKPFADVIGLLVKSGANEVIDPNVLINWKSAKDLTRKYARMDNTDNNYKVLFALMFYDCDNLPECIKLFRLENDLLKSLQFIYSNLNFSNNLYGDLNKTLTIFTNKDFEILNEVSLVINGDSISKKERQVLSDLAKNLLPDNKKLSNALIGYGVQGQQFGKMLGELRNWYYGSYLFTHTKPSQEEIEEYIDKLVR